MAQSQVPILNVSFSSAVSCDAEGTASASTAHALMAFGRFRFVPKRRLPAILVADSNSVVARLAPIQVVRWSIEYTRGSNGTANAVDRIFRPWITGASFGGEDQAQVAARS